MINGSTPAKQAVRKSGRSVDGVRPQPIGDINAKAPERERPIAETNAAATRRRARG
jgi:hypothetical protein